MADFQPAAQTASIDYTALPAAVINGIVQNLAHADQAKLLVICKAWSRPVASAMYSSPLLQSPDSFERLIQLLNTPLPAHPYPELIRELDIGASAADNLYMGDLDNALAMCTGLEVFRLENCFHISNILVRSLSAHCTNLKQIDLPGCPISDSFIPVLSKNCRQIERLDLSFTNLTVASLHAIVMNCESLLQLDLSECRPLEDDVSLDLSTKNLTRPLKCLSLRNTSVSDELLRFAATHCPNLEDLVLESCTEITDDAIIKIASTCTKLRRLDMSFCDNITDLSLQAFAMRASSTRGGTLKELYLTACDNISPPAVQYLAQQCLQLELLVLDGCDKLLGTYVQSFSHQPSEDELECLIEGEAVRRFAQHIPGANLVTPPASPSRVAPVEARSYKVQVSYAPAHGEARSINGGWRNGVSSVYGQDPAAIAAAALEAAKTGNYHQPQITQRHHQQITDKTVVRRPSRTMSLRKRPSLMNMAEAAAEAEAAKQERQEKIREKRRSRVFTATAANELAEAAAAISLATPAPSSPYFERSAVSSPLTSPAAASASPEPVPASKIPLASGRRRSQILPKASVPSPSTGWANGGSDAGTAGAPLTAEPHHSASEQSPRRYSSHVLGRPLSVMQASPAITPGALSAFMASGVATPPASAALQMDGEQPVLLASGRAARAAAREAAAATAAAVSSAPRCESPTSNAADTAAAPVLLASGRRRSRTNSVASVASIRHSEAGSAAYPAPTAPAAQWGANPTAWNNPAQLTSASSQWSSNSQSNGSPAPLSQQSMPAPAAAGFVDPWAKTPAHRTPAPAPLQSQASNGSISTDPWAARPGSAASTGSTFSQPATSLQQQYFSQPSQQPATPSHDSQPQRYGHLDRAPHHQAFPSPQLHSRPSSPNIRLAAAPGWGARTPPPGSATPNGSGAWAGSASSGQQQQTGYFDRAARNRTTSAPYADEYRERSISNHSPAPVSGGGGDGFAYSQQRRGKMLLKLKIETQSGGHQTLAVHEHDDPAQLAAEFTSHWDMAGFREPLVRLISVRKSNAIRQRAGFQ